METRTIDAYGCIYLNKQTIYFGGDSILKQVACLGNTNFRLVESGEIILPKQRPTLTMNDEVTDEICK